MIKPKFDKQPLFFSGILFVISAAQLACGAADQMNLKSNRQLWRESGSVNYRMKIYINQTGHATPNGNFTITVRNDRVESIKNKNDLEISDINADIARQFARYDTIDDIFNFIENGTKDDPYGFRVEYDQKLGYPKKLNLHSAKDTFDDELFFQVLEFEVL